MTRHAMAIDTDFPGGNAILEAVDGGEVRLRQDQRGSTQPWFYWHFRVRGAAGRTLRFTFTDWDVIGTRGPCVSRDGGRTYAWLGRGNVDGPSFAYAFAGVEHETYFCFCLPYTRSHLEAFLEPYRDTPELRRETLCVTRKGRPVERLHLGRGDDLKVVITARHHACETSASYVLEGLMAAVLTGDPWLREHAEIMVVPFVDTDGVEDGDQGKARGGRDHNRDYDGTSLYPETAALRRLLPAWGNGRLRVALDLHCPWIRGPRDHERIYMVGSSIERIWQEQKRFAIALETSTKGQLAYRAADDLPFGRGWNTPANSSAGLSFTGWMAQEPFARLVSTLETPYANVGEAVTTPVNLRAFGRELAMALRAYLDTESSP